VVVEGKQDGFKGQVQQVKTKTSKEMLENSHGKDGKQRTFPTARRRRSLWIYSKTLLHWDF